MIRTSGDGDETRVGSGNVCLAFVVIPPSYDRPVGLQAETVIRACGDSDETARKVDPDDLRPPADDRTLRGLRLGDQRPCKGRTCPGTKNNRSCSLQRHDSSSARFAPVAIASQETRGCGFRPRLDANSDRPSSPSPSRGVRRQIA